MQGSDGALSFTELVLNASFLVQLVMLFLLILSVVSWTIIIQRSNQYKLGRKKAKLSRREQFTRTRQTLDSQAAAIRINSVVKKQMSLKTNSGRELI